MAESQTHLHLKLSVAEALKKFGYKTTVEKHIEGGGREDIHAIDDETGEEMTIEIWNTNMPNRYVVRVANGKLMSIDYELAQPEYEKKKALWQQLSLINKEEDKLPQLYREKDQYEICSRFLNLIQGKYGKFQMESPRILNITNEIFSFLRRKRTYY